MLLPKLIPNRIYRAQMCHTIGPWAKLIGETRRRFNSLIMCNVFMVAPTSVIPQRAMVHGLLVSDIGGLAPRLLFWDYNHKHGILLKN